MASDRMCGVVLWSCPDEGRAVIWCEDQGGLAFYAQSHAPQVCCDAHSGFALDAGDLIDFEVETQPNQRRAHNPRLLVAHHAPCIATELRACGATQAADALDSAETESGTVVAFKPRAKTVSPDRFSATA